MIDRAPRKAGAPRPTPRGWQANQRLAASVVAVFATQFVSFVFIHARNIAQPGIIQELDGMALFSWLVALPAMTGSVSTLVFGKLSDLYGRRPVLLFAIGLFVLGLGISARATTMPFLIAAATFMSIGHFPIIPLCFTSIGDLFSPAERAKWTGLLSLPSGLAALIGPVLGGVIAESAVGWRGLYWGTIPLMLLAGGLAATGLPGAEKKVRAPIDYQGTSAMVLATATLIVGASWLGAPERRGMGILLLIVSLVAWIGFIRVERRARAPILDPSILVNRTFLTVAAAALLSSLSTLAIATYSPIFVQNVMKIVPTTSGSMLTPYATIVAFLGIPTGFLLARSGRYKWIYRFGYGIATVAMLAMWRFTADTPIWVYVLVTAVAGLGLGAIPTVNTLVAQLAVPRSLTGVAVGAMFFFQMVGLSVAPALLGLAQGSAADLESGLQAVFMVGAIAMAISLLVIITTSEIRETQPSDG